MIDNAINEREANQPSKRVDELDKARVADIETVFNDLWNGQRLATLATAFDRARPPAAGPRSIRAALADEESVHH